MRMRRDLIDLYPQLAQTITPEALRNFNKHVFFPKFLQDASMIDALFPDTIDEQNARNENEILKDNKYAKVSPADDHLSHLYIHQSVFPKSLALIFHLAEHKQYLAEAKMREQQQIQMQQMMAMQNPAQMMPEGEAPETSEQTAAEASKNPNLA